MNEDHNNEIGTKLRDIRTRNDMTLKQLAEKTDLSISFLSQVERGQATLGVNAMARVAAAFNVDMGYFFARMPETCNDPVVHSYERTYVQTSSAFVQYGLRRNLVPGCIQPQMTVLMPNNDPEEQLTVFNHPNEEFIYVLEGILTITIDDQTYTLYPHDCITVLPNSNHTWSNNTNMLTRLISVLSPNNAKK